MYKITFDQIDEIRMGSPYNIARIKVDGGYSPDTAQESFQDKYALSSDGDTCFLVVWDSTRNEPAFTVWKVSDREKSVKKSKLISGACQEITYLSESNTLKAVVWSHPQGTRTEVIHF
jgi:hypothetical protein